MDFVEVAVVNIDGEAAETVSELFNRYGYGGAVIEAIAPDFERVTVRTVIPFDDEAKRREIEVMLALIGKALPQGLPEPRFTAVGKNDWASGWKEHFHVVHIGRNFVIKPGWRDYTPAGDDIVIEIDPGLAFGSGLHPTTRLCLEIFEDLPLADLDLFDVGTGSGILTIAALKLGVQCARAVDIDAVAVRVAEENFSLNGVTERVETGIGSAANTGGRTWPLVVANILAHVLIQLMPDLAAAATTNGIVMLSGMIVEQETDVRAAAQAHGLHVESRYQEEDWVALVTRKIST
jgi:ribosomal protein L11 methyltransferase